jgi:hypothetical protein
MVENVPGNEFDLLYLGQEGNFAYKFYNLDLWRLCLFMSVLIRSYNYTIVRAYLLSFLNYHLFRYQRIYAPS